MEAGYIIEILTLEYLQICYEKKIENLRIMLPVPFCVQLCELRIAITCVMQPSLHSFHWFLCQDFPYYVFFVAIRISFCICLITLIILFQLSKLLQLASFSLLNNKITQGLGNQILFLLFLKRQPPSGPWPPNSWRF